MTNNHIRNTLPFTNTNNEIRKEVFLLIQNLYVIEANNLLINQYDHETEINKIALRQWQLLAILKLRFRSQSNC
jgi:hypothetical protein